MGQIIYQAVIPLEPKTKKNSQVIRFRKLANKMGFYKRSAGHFTYAGIPWIAQNKDYEGYEETAQYYLKMPQCGTITQPVNIRCIFYRANNRKCDLTNLLEAVDDILVKRGIIKDDCYKILCGHDGSRVLIDKDKPRTEIYIEFFCDV